MKQARPALRYAKALLSLAKEQGVDAEVNENFKMIAATIAESSELRVMLKSPIIKPADKRKVLTALFGDKVNNITKGLFNILEENKRLLMLETVAKRYNVIYDYHKNIQVAKVTTAVPITDALQYKIEQKIIALTGNEATIENIINPDIIGGFILRVGDVQYDASIANQFNELKKEFDNSHYVPKI